VTATDTQDQIFGYSSGLLDDFEGKIIEAYFAIDPAYFEAAVLLHLVMETNDADVPSVTEKYSVGKFWQASPSAARTAATSCSTAARR
jgi:hypothetical protein